MIAICVFASIGLANILKYGSILKPLRGLLFKISFFKEMFSCSMCLGFWSGLIISIIVYRLGISESALFLLMPLVSSCTFQLFDVLIDFLIEKSSPHPSKPYHFGYDKL
tara:strand:- start:3284 stop:3610 length:327 start_codon:yes stop_codon:yes gene_type:complete